MVALLPLDAPGKLAIYGQPVANEVARTLAAAGLEVVVVGAQMAVPQDAVLVVEGSITSARRRVTVELRLRTLDSRAALATAVATGSSLATLDRAASSVALQLLPQVKAELAKRRAPPAVLAPALPVQLSSAPAAVEPPVALIVVRTAAGAADTSAVFRSRLVAAAGVLAAQRWRSIEIALPEISPALMIGAISTRPGAIGLAFDVSELSMEQTPVLIGKVRARTIVTFDGRTIFDRILVTDTIIGGRKVDRDSMLELMAREVVAILRPRFVSLLSAKVPIDSSTMAHEVP
jgi:hypothetical protein